MSRHNDHWRLLQSAMLSADVHGDEPLSDAIRHMLGVVNVLADNVAEMTGRTVPDEIRRAATIVERGE